MHVFYINLNSRTDRRLYAEAQFKALGVIPERVEAVYCKNGAIGCALSHVKCIELAKKRNLPYVCICEDDILFLKPNITKQSIDDLLNPAGRVNWDVLLLGANIAPPYYKLDRNCLRVKNAQTTTGYIVKQHYYDTLLHNIKSGISELLMYQIPRLYAIDIYWKKLQKLDLWGIIIPLAVVQRPDYSDIEQRHVNYTKHMLDIKSFLNSG
jgi:GR25 family glycosyltransferase involved in LPS biosynthesis